VCLIAPGWDNARIADELGLSEQTVRNYVSRLYGKIGVQTRAEAVVWAREHAGDL
jgi:DNA-binding NarL/FixJ family response regulator